MSKNTKKLGKKKKAGIIGGCALVGGVITDALLVAASPATGGLSLAALAAKKTTEVSTAALVGLGVTAGAGGGSIVTKVIDKKREEKAYKQGCEDASKHYEAKFEKQAQEFANTYNQILNDSDRLTQLIRKLEQDIEKKDHLIEKCLQYIQDLEKEQDSLKRENKTLSKDKQELLDTLRRINKEILN